jgi:hypothetical protein
MVRRHVVVDIDEFFTDSWKIGVTSLAPGSSGGWLPTSMKVDHRWMQAAAQLAWVR